MYGVHYNEERQLPECIIGGNMCDACFEAMMAHDRLQEEKQYLQILSEKGFRPTYPTQCVVPEMPPDAKSVYELTLTTTKDDPYELRMWMAKIAESAMFDIIDLPYCIELQHNGKPHTHGLVYSRRKTLDASKVKKLKFPYRYELKKVRNLEAYNNYILKEKDNPIIIDYCLKKGIPQFDNAVSKTNES